MTESLAKDFHRLLKNISSITDGQAEVSHWDDEDLSRFTVQISPNTGYYKGGKFAFQVTLEDGFISESPPNVMCLTDVYHPNIDTKEEEPGSTNVCLNILESGTWNPAFGLEGCVVGLVFLMHNPNYGDPLSPLFEPDMSEEEFEENVKRYMAGQDVEGTDFKTDFIVKSIDVVNETKEEDTVEGQITLSTGNDSLVQVTASDTIPQDLETADTGIIKDGNVESESDTENIKFENEKNSNSNTRRDDAITNVRNETDSFKDVVAVYVFGF